jgi:hypothetical protein
MKDQRFQTSSVTGYRNWGVNVPAMGQLFGIGMRSHATNPVATMFRMMVQSNKIHQHVLKRRFSSKADWHETQHASRLGTSAPVEGGGTMLRETYVFRSGRSR